ncbi:ferredoxin family protein [Clostridium sp. D43t1_170807_H7]|uniref:4Fe-4S dicluster domain-containing protein n=1 Tax=Clostridium sp. D43t1_170807_H7 TaxID=2787140 RepID=UPI00189A8166|nr:ferredoxin family protein [Clostridium sp. D43t1_170807_H7]MEE0933420.1 ferredoxin family protein [Clostridium sp.]
MSIAINKEKCVSCKKCTLACPGNLIKIGDDLKAFIKYPTDCWGCCSCIKECGTSAIALYLGADIGGRGSLMTVKNNDGILRWTIEETNGNKHYIDINPKDSNKY